MTLGTTSFPAGATAQPCEAGAFFAQAGTDGAYQYTVPAGDGVITSWSTATTGSAPGSSLTFVVLRPSGSGYTSVGYDAQTMPTPLPASGIAAFNVAAPITVAAGDVIALQSSKSEGICYYTGSAISAADTVTAGAAGSGIGAMYTPIVSAVPPNLVNVSAELSQNQDVTVTGAATPASITAGGVSSFAFGVGNNGPGVGPITFTDTVPAGLTVLSAVTGSGTCSTVAQTVTCTISGLPTGGTAPVSIIVAASSAGSYPNVASVSASLADPNSADNTASTVLAVNAAPVIPPPVPPACKTIALKGTTLALAKKVIVALNCKVGKVTKAASKTVKKGLVVSTSPGSGKTLANGATIKIVESSGPPKKKAAKKKKSTKKKH